MKVNRWQSWAIGAAVGFASALWLGWVLWHHAPVHEGEAIERHLPGGAVLVERDPQAPVPKPVQRAAREARGTLERSTSITVQPEVVQVAPQAGVGESGHTAGSDAGDAGSNPAAGNRAPPVCSCGPVTIDLGLVRMPDETRRVVATATGGVIIGAIDIPIEAARPRAEARWAAGVSFSQQREVGAWADRAVGPFTLGVAVEARKREGLTAVARVGIRW